MKLTVQVVLHADDDTETVLGEAPFTLIRQELTPETLGLQLQRPRTCSPRCRPPWSSIRSPPRWPARRPARTAESRVGTRTAGRS